MVIKAIHDSIRQQEVIPFAKNPFNLQRFTRVAEEILSGNPLKVGRSDVGSLLFHDGRHSDRFVKFILDHEEGYLTPIFLVNGEIVEWLDEQHIDLSDFEQFAQMNAESAWDAFLEKVMNLLEVAVVQSILDGTITEQDFYAPPTKYDFTKNSTSILGSVRTLCAVSESLKRALEEGGALPRNMDVWFDEAVFAVESLKKTVMLRETVFREG